MLEMSASNLVLHASVIQDQHTKWIREGNTEEERRIKLEELLTETKKKINKEE